ncbi:MAG: hypothetical protein ACLSTJ_01735 [Clostridium neonatale]
MEQQELRNKVKYLISFYGSTQQFIAKSIGVNRSTINLFIKDERNLAEPIERKLKEFLNERISF